MVLCCFAVLSAVPLSAYATSLSQSSMIDHSQFINSEPSVLSAGQNNFELGVIGPCPQGLSVMAWWDGIVICSSPEGLVSQFLVADLINELESIQRNHDLSNDEKIVYLSDLMRQHSLLSQDDHVIAAIVLSAEFADDVLGQEVAGVGTIIKCIGYCLVIIGEVLS